MIAAADDLELARCATAIRTAAPNLRDIEPLTLDERDADLLVVRTAGSELFQLPQSERGANAAGVQTRLLPFLRGHVEPTLPQPAWESGPSDEAPFGLWGQRKLPGVPLRVETVPDRWIMRMAGSIAAFLLGLHRFPVKQAQALTVPGPRTWRQHFEEVGREGLPPLRGELSFSEFGRLRRWWRNFMGDDRNWSYEPTLVHGDLRPGDLLVDPEQTELVAVDRFNSATLGDPAIDFAGLVRCTDPEFSWRVVDAYRRGGGQIGAAALRRVRLLGTAVSVRVAARAACNDDAEGLTTIAAELRAGPVLSGPPLGPSSD